MRMRRWVCAIACICAALGMNCGKALAQSVRQAPLQSTDFTPEAMAAIPGNMIPFALVRQVRPAYPWQARDGQLDGEVLMTATIATDGSVEDIKVTHGLPQLINAAKHAVSQWRYSPARINGVAVPVNTIIGLNFKLADPGVDANEQNLLASLRPIPIPSPVFKTALPPPPVGAIRISERTMRDLIVTRAEPVYPGDAIALDARGTVVLLATIDTLGKVSDVQVVSGPLRFRESAAEAVKRWTYTPYSVDEGPVTVQSTVTLEFAPPKHGSSQP